MQPVGRIRFLRLACFGRVKWNPGLSLFCFHSQAALKKQTSVTKHSCLDFLPQLRPNVIGTSSQVLNLLKPWTKMIFSLSWFFSGICHRSRNIVNKMDIRNKTHKSFTACISAPPSHIHPYMQLQISCQ